MHDATMLHSEVTQASPPLQTAQHSFQKFSYNLFAFFVRDLLVHFWQLPLAIWTVALAASGVPWQSTTKMILMSRRLLRMMKRCSHVPLTSLFAATPKQFLQSKTIPSHRWKWYPLPWILNESNSCRRGGSSCCDVGAEVTLSSSWVCSR